MYKRDGEQKKAKQRGRKRPVTPNFAGLKENNVALLLQSSGDLLSRETFWATVLIVLSCHVLTSMVRVIDFKIAQKMARRETKLARVNGRFV